MGLPEKFDRRLKDNLDLRAVWLPGTEISLGDVLEHKDGVFRPIGNLRDFSVKFNKKALGKKVSLSLQAKGVAWTVVQAGAKVDPLQVDAKAEAEVKLEFKSKDAYFIRTAELAGVGIPDLIRLGRAVRGNPDWHHKDYFISWQVYRAKEFVFLGSKNKNSTIRFMGGGKAILDFLTIGATANVSRVAASGVIIEMIGEGGPIAMRVRRIKRNGQLW
jgi:hypothetical protein